MNFKYRQGGSWNSPTVKKREKGGWVTVGGSGSSRGSGNAGHRFYTEGPPTRSGDTISYPSDGHSSIEAAFKSLSSGDELFIEDGTYNETIYIDTGDIADHITMRGNLDLSFNSDGKASVAQEGATITNSGNVIEFDRHGYGVDNSFTSPVSPGDQTVEIDDASPYSVGDVVLLIEPTRPYGEPPSGGASGASETIEHRQIAEVDTSNDTLTFNHPVNLPYPLDNTPAGVDFYEKVVSDIHISGLRFDGQGAGSRPCRFYSLHEAWIDNVISTNAGDDNLMALRCSFRCRLDQIHLENGGHYGINCYEFSTDNMMTNISSLNHNRYSVRFGPSGAATSGGYVDGVYGENISRTVGAVHNGGFNVKYYNFVGDSARMMVTRGRNTTLDGFELKSGRVNDNDNTLICAQRPVDVVVKNGKISDKDSNYAFKFRLRDSNNSPNGNERVDNVTYENIDIDDYGPSITDIGEFEIQGDPPVSGPLTFRNVTYGGQQLIQSDVEAWKGYDSNYVPDLTVE